MRAVGHPPLLRPGWVVYALFVLNPLFWVLGFGGFIWSAAALPLVMWILMRRNLERPLLVAPFALYVAWAMFTVVRVDRFTRLLAFGFRYSVYVTALCLAYYVYNERRVSRTTFVNWVAMFWVWAIIGGYLGLLFPRARLRSHPGQSAPAPVDRGQ